MNCSTYIESYYIIGGIACISYLIYKTLTAKVDDDSEEITTVTVTLFLFWIIVIPVALFVWIQNKLKK